MLKSEDQKYINEAFERYYKETDSETLRLLAKDARERSENGAGENYKLKQKAIADACERELELRG